MNKDETLKMALDFLMTRRMGAEAVIEALNEALAQPPLPVQEPVAWMCSAFDGDPCELTNHDECENPIPLYTAPPQRQPLTDEQIQKIWDVAAGALPGWSRHITYARAIEAAHNIKEQP